MAIADLIFLLGVVAVIGQDFRRQSFPATRQIGMQQQAAPSRRFSLIQPRPRSPQTSFNRPDRRPNRLAAISPPSKQTMISTQESSRFPRLPFLINNEKPSLLNTRQQWRQPVNRQQLNQHRKQHQARLQQHRLLAENSVRSLGSLRQLSQEQWFSNSRSARPSESDRQQQRRPDQLAELEKQQRQMIDLRLQSQALLSKEKQRRQNAELYHQIPREQQTLQPQELQTLKQNKIQQLQPQRQQQQRERSLALSESVPDFQNMTAEGLLLAKREKIYNLVKLLGLQPSDLFNIVAALEAGKIPQVSYSRKSSSSSQSTAEPVNSSPTPLTTHVSSEPELWVSESIHVTQEPSTVIKRLLPETSELTPLTTPASVAITQSHLGTIELIDRLTRLSGEQKYSNDSPTVATNDTNYFSSSSALASNETTDASTNLTLRTNSTKYVSSSPPSASKESTHGFTVSVLATNELSDVASNLTNLAKKTTTETTGLKVTEKSRTPVINQSKVVNNETRQLSYPETSSTKQQTLPAQASSNEAGMSNVETSEPKHGLPKNNRYDVSIILGISNVDTTTASTFDLTLDGSNPDLSNSNSENLTNPQAITSPLSRSSGKVVNATRGSQAFLPAVDWTGAGTILGPGYHVHNQRNSTNDFEIFQTTTRPRESTHAEQQGVHFQSTDKSQNETAVTWQNVTVDKSQNITAATSQNVIIGKPQNVTVFTLQPASGKSQNTTSGGMSNANHLVTNDNVTSDYMPTDTMLLMELLGMSNSTSNIQALIHDNQNVLIRNLTSLLSSLLARSYPPYSDTITAQHPISWGANMAVAGHIRTHDVEGKSPPVVYSDIANSPGNQTILADLLELADTNVTRQRTDTTAMTSITSYTDYVADNFIPESNQNTTFITGDNHNENLPMATAIARMYGIPIEEAMVMLHIPTMTTSGRQDADTTTVPPAGDVSSVHHENPVAATFVRGRGLSAPAVDNKTLQDATIEQEVLSGSNSSQDNVHSKSLQNLYQTDHKPSTLSPLRSNPDVYVDVQGTQPNLTEVTPESRPISRNGDTNVLLVWKAAVTDSESMSPGSGVSSAGLNMDNLLDNNGQPPVHVGSSVTKPQGHMPSAKVDQSSADKILKARERGDVDTSVHTQSVLTSSSQLFLNVSRSTDDGHPVTETTSSREFSQSTPAWSSHESTPPASPLYKSATATSTSAV